MTLPDARELEALLAHCPAVVILESGEALQRFRALFRDHPNAAGLVESCAEAVVDYLTDPLLRRELFMEHIFNLYNDFHGLTAATPLVHYTQALQAMGVDIAAQLLHAGLGIQGKYYHRYDGLLGCQDIVLRRLTLDDLEEIYVPERL